jgi:hypothetical protein
MLHKIHRLSATVIGTYILFHLFNHLIALKGINAHIEFMKEYRKIYRFPALEFLLLFLVASQITSGIYFVVKRWGHRHGFFEKAQVLSGDYLAFFLLIHVLAVVSGRVVLKLDTNFYYAAAGLNISPFQAFFMPYYFLSIVALFTHAVCAFHWLSRGHIMEHIRNNVSYAFILLGIVPSTIIVAAFMGAFYAVDIPAEYRATFE